MNTFGCLWVLLGIRCPWVPLFNCLLLCTFWCLMLIPRIGYLTRYPSVPNWSLSSSFRTTLNFLLPFDISLPVASLVGDWPPLLDVFQSFNKEILMSRGRVWIHSPFLWQSIRHDDELQKEREGTQWSISFYRFTVDLNHFESSWRLLDFKIKMIKTPNPHLISNKMKNEPNINITTYQILEQLSKTGSRFKNVSVSYFCKRRLVNF